MSEKKEASQVISDIKARRERRLQQEKKRNLIIAAAAAALLVIILIIVLCLSCGGEKKDGSTGLMDTLAGKPPVTEEVSPTEPDGTENGRPEVTPAPVPTPVPDVMLPVYDKVSSAGKKIAITVNVLGNVDNFNEIMTLAESSSVPLTVFPLGKFINENEDMQTAMRRAFSAGYEIENLTYSLSNLYSLTDEEMAAEIWSQNIAVNNVIGGDYEMHFLRTNKGYGKDDAWIHQYLVQLGTYKGYASWEVNAAGMEKYNSVKSGLKPGAIFMFGTSDRDVKFLNDFIPYALEQGYEIVTLNDLVGCEKNECKPRNANAEMPIPEEFVYVNYVTLDGENYRRMHAAKLVQERLMELGYPIDVADGDYGKKSKEAVKLFQQAAGLDVDGIAGKGTQRLLFSVDAPAYDGEALAAAANAVPAAE